MSIRITCHHGVQVVRDDLMGGTKMVCMPLIEEDGIDEYVYASTVYGGFQISLATYFGKKATIFCAKRKIRHANTLRCLELGANIIEVPYGYLSVVEKHARDYCNSNSNLKIKCKKIIFGGQEYIDAIESHVKSFDCSLIDEIWCAVGSGTLVSAICRSFPKIQVYGVIVGAEVKLNFPNLHLINYPKPFSYESKFKAGFPSMPNYDLKAFEICLLESEGRTLFWNVL